MNEQIKKLHSEIKSYQLELSKLHIELDALSQPIPQPQSDNPVELAKLTKKHAAEDAERKLKMQSVQAAIEALVCALNERKLRLAELEQDLADNDAAAREAALVAKIEAYATKVNELSDEIKVILGQVADEYIAYRGGKLPIETSNSIWTHDVSLRWKEVPKVRPSASLPYLIKNDDGSYSVDMVSYNPFQPTIDAALADCRTDLTAKLAVKREQEKLKQIADLKVRIAKYDAEISPLETNINKGVFLPSDRMFSPERQLAGLKRGRWELQVKLDELTKLK